MYVRERIQDVPAKDQTLVTNGFACGVELCQGIMLRPNIIKLRSTWNRIISFAATGVCTPNDALSPDIGCDCRRAYVGIHRCHACVNRLHDIRRVVVYSVARVLALQERHFPPRTLLLRRILDIIPNNNGCI